MHAIRHDQALRGTLSLGNVVVLDPARPCRNDGARLASEADGQASAKLRLMKLARAIEPDARRLAEWWTQTPIGELDGHTAEELLAMGMQGRIEQFLLAIVFGDRG